MSDDTAESGATAEEAGSEAPPTAGDPEPATAATDEEAAAAPTDDAGPVDADRLVRYLQYALVVGLAVFAAVAAMNVYANVGAVINEWVAREYRPLFRAAFNLVVLFVAAAGLIRLVRRLRSPG